MQINIGSYSISMKYLFKRTNRNTFYYKRRVPKDLKFAYPKPFIEISLRQTDKVMAAIKCEQQHKTVEQEFKRLRQGLPKTEMLTNYQAALKHLDTFKLAPQDANIHNNAAEHARDRFYETLDDTIRQKTTLETYSAIDANEIAFSTHLLNDEQRSALAIIQGEFRLTASQYPLEYLRLTDKADNRKKVTECNRAIASLIKHCGDRPPAQYARSDLNHYIKESGATKKTQTVSRQLKSIAAMFNLVSLEMDIAIDRQHAFTDFKIPGLGNDAKDKSEFTKEQIQTIRNMPLSKTPEITHMIQLMLDTGMRIKECCGLMIDDIIIDKTTPYLILYRNNVRDIKSKNSKRFVALVGSSLSAMQQAVTSCAGKFIFPRYVDEMSGKVKNDNASAACNKRLSLLLGEGAPQSHSFRHTLQTRLRNVECPKDIRDELGGWAKDISDNYGSPADLTVKQSWLLRSLDAPEGVKRF